MSNYLNQILSSQFEASLCMMHHCIKACPPKDWEGKIANATFRQVAYHTLFFVDLYLTESEEAFQLRELHRTGGDEREPGSCAALDKEATLAYLTICLEKLRTTLAGESEEPLRGPSGFSWCKFTRAEMHVYNLRHVQHHTGQLSSHLRRLVPGCRERSELRWVSTG